MVMNRLSALNLPLPPLPPLEPPLNPPPPPENPPPPPPPPPVAPPASAHAGVGMAATSRSTRIAIRAGIRRPLRPRRRLGRPGVGVDVLLLDVVAALLALLDLVEHPAAFGVADEGPVLLEGGLRELVAVDHLAGSGVLHPVAGAALDEGDEPVLAVVGDVDDPDDLDIVELEVGDPVDPVLAFESFELELVARVEGIAHVRARRGYITVLPRLLDREEALAHAR